MHDAAYWAARFSVNTLTSTVAEDTLTFSECVDRVYDYISHRKTTSGQSKAPGEAREDIEQQIIMYITEKRPRVQGYIDQNSHAMEFKRLAINLSENITSYDILTQAYQDPSVSEIRINGLRGIWVERRGRAELLRDNITGQRLGFQTVDDCVKIINKLLRFSNAKFGKDSPIANGITLEGYRIAATHQECSAADKGAGALDKAPYCVIRKFSEDKFTFRDLVTFKSMGAEMANMLQTLPAADTTILVVGATGSGKTVVVQGLVDKIPGHRRLVIIENPSELRARLYDEEGFMINDVIQWEAKDPPPGETPPASFPTYANLMIQALRMSPHYFVFGELRTDLEFSLALTAANTGHYFIATYHSPTALDGIDRYVIAAMGASGNLPREIVLSRVCKNIDFVVVQQKLNDGNRKIMEIAEVMGTKLENGILVANLNRIYEWRPDKSGLAVDDHNREYIPGQHFLVGEISEEMQTRLIIAGLNKEQLGHLFRPLGENKQPVLCSYDARLVAA